MEPNLRYEAEDGTPYPELLSGVYQTLYESRGREAAGKFLEESLLKTINVLVPKEGPFDPNSLIIHFSANDLAELALAHGVILHIEEYGDLI